MKKIIQIIAALAVAFVMPLSALASNPPSIPVMVYGSVKIDGALAPVGAKVTAQVGNAEVASFTLAEAGKYFMNLSGDTVSVGSVIKFKINDKVVTDAEGKYKMVNVNTVSSVKYDLAITSPLSEGTLGGTPPSGGRPATPAKPATPADPKTDTPAVPAIPAIPASDDNGQVKAGVDVNVIDGDIIQCKNSVDPFAVYIVKVVNGKKFIRHIVSLQIFNHYKHLKWENLIQVESLDGFLLSGWVRVNTGANGAAGGGDRVWEINGDQTKHWIDMTAAEFLLHGGSDEAIYSINPGELGLYKEGAAVKLK